MSQRQLERNQNQRLKRQLQADIDRLHAELEEIKKQLAQKLKESKLQLQELEKKKKELQEKRQEVIDNDLARKQIEVQIRQLNRSKEQLEGNIKETQNQINENSSLISNLQNQIQILDELLKKLNFEDLQTRNSLKEKKEELLKNEAELAQQTEKLEQLDMQIRDLQSQIAKYFGRRLNKQDKQKVEGLRKELKNKKQSRGNLKSVITKFRTLISGIHSLIGDLSADSKRICAQILGKQSLVSSKQQFLGNTQTKNRAQQQKLNQLTEMKDSTKQKIEQSSNNLTERIQKDKQIKNDIQIKQDDYIKIDKSYQTMVDEANELKMEEKVLKREEREKKYQKNFI